MKMRLLVLIVSLSACDFENNEPVLSYDNLRNYDYGKVKCVGSFNYLPNVKDKPLPISDIVATTLGEYSRHHLPVLPETKHTNNSPDFYEYFTSYQNCETTFASLKRNKKFNKCIIDIEEITLEKYLNFLESPPEVESWAGKNLYSQECEL